MTGAVKNATSKIETYRRLAEEHHIAVNDTGRKIAVSRNASAHAVGKVYTVIMKLEDLLSQLDQLETIDHATLERLENIEKKDHAAAEEVAKQFGDLQKTQILIRKSLSMYEFDLEKLKKQIAHTRTIYDSLPNACLKQPPPPEG